VYIGIAPRRFGMVIAATSERFGARRPLRRSSRRPGFLSAAKNPPEHFDENRCLRRNAFPDMNRAHRHRAAEVDGRFF
jgi:hypothetical protein